MFNFSDADSFTAATTPGSRRMEFSFNVPNSSIDDLEQLNREFPTHHSGENGLQEPIDGLQVSLTLNKAFLHSAVLLDGGNLRVTLSADEVELEDIETTNEDVQKEIRSLKAKATKASNASEKVETENTNLKEENASLKKQIEELNAQLEEATAPKETPSDPFSGGNNQSNDSGNQSGGDANQGSGNQSGN